MANTMTFAIGALVQSSPDSSDVKSMKATWVASIHAIVAPNDEGGCYETLGHWVPLTDEHGNVDTFWDDHKPDAAPTLRQL